MKFEEYQRQGWADYSALSQTVAAILKAAITATGDYRLQYVFSRAKGATSLRRKLELRGKQRGVDLIAVDALEDEIKDLAGCRVVFYTNSDVTRLIGSGLIQDNFEVIETKLHHPRYDAADPVELYVSNHYLVILRPERLALPEYARFAGMRCEIQIQTILNHAWAEMARDTIYKEPDLNTFGTRALDAIKTRMGRIARKYLSPAGHEFAKVAADFERLLKGKELFEGKALEAINEAADNNTRADAIDTFTESVLPLYDDIAPEFPDILSTLVKAVKRARVTSTQPIETPYGTLPAKTVADIVRRAAKVIQDYRYVDPDAVFDALLILFGEAESEEERKPLVEAAQALAKHNLQVWKRYGPEVQIMLVDKMERLSEAERITALPIITSMLEAVLGTEMSGTTSTSGAVTFHRGDVKASEPLSAMRRRAIALLKALYALASEDEHRRKILSAWRIGMRPPSGSGYTLELAPTLMEAAAELIEFEAAQVHAMSWELRQREERAILNQFRINRALPTALQADRAVAVLRDRIDAAVKAFRAVIDADEEYAIYKVLVGFNVVYPPAWDDRAFNYEQEQNYRNQAVNAMVESITPEHAVLWHARAVRCAQTQSDDLATFPLFNAFLQRAGEQRSQVVLRWLEPTAPPLTRFLPPMLIGLQRSAATKVADAKMREWISKGSYLGEIAWYLRHADRFDETLLVAVIDKAREVDDRDAVRTAMSAAGARFPAHPNRLIERVFMPGLMHMRAANDISWVGQGFAAWFNVEILEALDEMQAAQVLNALIIYPTIDNGAAQIVGAIARPWPGRVLHFFEMRERVAVSGERPEHYSAIPFSLDEQLQKRLAEHLDLVLSEVRGWYDRDPTQFTYRGGRLIAAIFPNLAANLPDRLTALIDGTREDISFALAILNAFEGGPQIEDVVRAAVARLEFGDDLLEAANNALERSGVVSGAYGFVERYQERLNRIRTWLEDGSDKVQNFAQNQIRYLERAIAAETRRSEAFITARRLDFDEDIVNPE